MSSPRHRDPDAVSAARRRRPAARPSSRGRPQLGVGQRSRAEVSAGASGVRSTWASEQPVDRRRAVVIERGRVDGVEERSTPPGRASGDRAPAQPVARPAVSDAPICSATRSMASRSDSSSEASMTGGREPRRRPANRTTVVPEGEEDQYDGEVEAELRLRRASGARGGGWPRRPPGGRRRSSAKVRARRPVTAPGADGAPAGRSPTGADRRGRYTVGGATGAARAVPPAWTSHRRRRRP